MRKIFFVLGLAIAAGCVTVQAATHEHDMSRAESPAAMHQGSGVLKSINVKDRKVLIAHQPIASLDWPAMTMWFALRDPLPDNLKVGESVRFEVMQGEGKQWVVVRIERK